MDCFRDRKMNEDCENYLLAYLISPDSQLPAEDIPDDSYIMCDLTGTPGVVPDLSEFVGSSLFEQIDTVHSLLPVVYLHKALLEKDCPRVEEIEQNGRIVESDFQHLDPSDAAQVLPSEDDVKGLADNLQALGVTVYDKMLNNAKYSEKLHNSVYFTFCEMHRTQHETAATNDDNLS
ncbi:unnamed protein product [Orchesella dallaii]|uniref:Uncharacterized protein n=1 Tax=Orchesella dallaii TaxID=48710 RepID=A0ABP1R656_9HEXA